MMHRIASLFWVSLLCLALVSCSQESQQEAADKAEKGTLMEGSIGRSELKVKPKWKQVLSVKNKKTTKTKHFKISGNEWKIRWRTKPSAQNPDEEFIIILYDKNDENVSEIIANVNGADEDFAFLEGKGEYYLSINTAQNYEIFVEEHK